MVFSFNQPSKKTQVYTISIDMTIIYIDFKRGFFSIGIYWQSICIIAYLVKALNNLVAYYDVH